MKVKNILLFYSLVLLLNSMNLADLQKQHQVMPLDSDNYGIANVWIIDKVTGLPIDEKYLIGFVPQDSKDPDILPYYLRAETGSNSYKSFASIKLPPGRYYLQFDSLSKKPKYCFDPPPYSEFGARGNRYTIEIGKGQITKVIKRVEKGGSLKIVLVDPSGNQIHFDLLKCDVSFYLDSEVFRFQKSSKSLTDDDLLDGELVIKDILFPAAYSIKIGFGSCGLGTVRKDNVKIEKGKTTEVMITINLNDTTGITGHLFDKNKIPIKGAEVDVTSGKIRGSYITDSNGFFKILGLKSDTYYLNVSIKIPDGIRIKNYGAVLIEENKLVNKDLILNLE
jgi:hypothetical protein